MGKEKGDLMVLPSLGVKASTFREESEERPYKRQVMAIEESFEESEDSKERRQRSRGIRRSRAAKTHDCRKRKSRSRRAQKQKSRKAEKGREQESGNPKNRTRLKQKKHPKGE